MFTCTSRRCFTGYIETKHYSNFKATTQAYTFTYINRKHTFIKQERRELVRNHCKSGECVGTWVNSLLYPWLYPIMLHHGPHPSSF